MLPTGKAHARYVPERLSPSSSKDGLPEPSLRPAFCAIGGMISGNLALWPPDIERDRAG
jgi:hypothetical protein